MKLTELQLKALTKMIETSSFKKLNTYKEENKLAPKEHIVFAGDSMIDYFPFDDIMPEYHILNRGIAGATTKSFLDTFDEVILPLKPKKLFISIGSNDLVMFDATAKEAVENIKHVLKIVREKLPDTELYYLSTTPVVPEDEKVYKMLYIGGRTNEQQEFINEQIKQENVHFINVYDALLDGQGFLELWYTADGIHLNRHGYAEYAKVLKEVLETF